LDFEVDLIPEALFLRGELLPLADDLPLLIGDYLLLAVDRAVPDSDDQSGDRRDDEEAADRQ
jgi:hypothetical protein